MFQLFQNYDVITFQFAGKITAFVRGKMAQCIYKKTIGWSFIFPEIKASFYENPRFYVFLTYFSYKSLLFLKFNLYVNYVMKIQIFIPHTIVYLSCFMYFFLLYKTIQIYALFQNNFMRKSWVTKNYLTEVPKYRFAFPLKKCEKSIFTLSF